MNNKNTNIYTNSNYNNNSSNNNSDIYAYNNYTNNNNNKFSMKKILISSFQVQMLKLHLTHVQEHNMKHWIPSNSIMTKGTSSSYTNNYKKNNNYKL
jgi:hypothetical protein